MLGRVFRLFWVFLLVFIYVGSLVTRGCGGVEELDTTVLRRWCREKLAIFPCRHSASPRWFFTLGRYMLGGPSASICDSGLSGRCSFIFDPICLLLSSMKKCLGLVKFF